MTWSISDVRRYLQRLRPFMPPPGYAPLAKYAQIDEEAVELSATDQQAQKKSLFIRSMVSILTIPVVILFLAALIMAFTIGGMLFGVALAVIRFLQMLPFIAIAALASGVTPTPTGYIFPTWHYAYRVVVQFFQAGLTGAGAFVAILGIIAAFATALVSARTASRRTREASATQKVARDSEVGDGPGSDKESGFRDCYTAVIEGLAVHFVFFPFVYPGVHILRWYYGSGWELFVPPGELARPVLLAAISEGIIKLVTVGRKYLRDRRAARRGVPDEEGSGADESVRLDVLEVDAPKP